ncbi:MAG TPA: SDR family oxidoreductase [Methylophilaceae bacterium]|nr:SDR family oxidoreductase [Methylophilaceae bacterium]
MATILIVGCGDLGSTVALQLAQKGHRVVGVRRSCTLLANVDILQADVTQPESLKKLEEIQPDLLIYCVAASGQTDAHYQAAYVDGLRNVLATQANNAALQHVFFVSSTRVYGQQTDAVLDENTPAMAADFGGERLLEGERLLNDLTCGKTVLRLSGIYGPGRLRMINLAKTPELWPAQNSWTNRIHRDDAANFLVLLVQKVLHQTPITPCYIVTDSASVSQYEVLHWLATQLRIPSNPHVPAIEHGKRLSNQAMLMTGFEMQYPDYRAGYAALLALNTG